MIAARRALLALVLLATGCTHAPEGALARVPLPPLRQASIDGTTPPVAPQVPCAPQGSWAAHVVSAMHAWPMPR